MPVCPQISRGKWDSEQRYLQDIVYFNVIVDSQGLSIYLFIFAFLGNTFYVASILTSPKLQLPPPQASAFIRESIPYVSLSPLSSVGSWDSSANTVTFSVVGAPLCSILQSFVSPSFTGRKGVYPGPDILPGPTTKRRQVCLVPKPTRPTRSRPSPLAGEGQAPHGNLV